jgi:hypothetical protein
MGGTEGYSSEASDGGTGMSSLISRIEHNPTENKIDTGQMEKRSDTSDFRIFLRLASARAKALYWSPALAAFVTIKNTEQD